MSNEWIFSRIKEQRILPLFYHADAVVCIEIVKALYAGGIRAIEFTNRGDNARQNAQKLIQYRNKYCNDLLIGIGTVSNQEDAVWFMKNGADFLVSPFFDAAVCDAASFNKVLWIPGCMTPTEIHTAMQAGCKLIKLFPGDLIGIKFLNAIKPLFKETGFIITGGVDATAYSINKWIGAGADAVGVGSKLITTALIEQQAYLQLTNSISSLLHDVVKK